MAEYRVSADDLIKTLMAWDELITGRNKIHLIACGGTALTLMGYKISTADVDFLIPVEKEYERLTHFLKQVGYECIGGHRWKHPDEVLLFDLFSGSWVFLTELLDSPLKPGRNRKIREFKKIYLGVLNSIDLIITKLARGTGADMDDCRLLLEHEKINMTELENRYKENAKYAIPSEEKALRNFEVFLKRLT